MQLIHYLDHVIFRKFATEGHVLYELLLLVLLQLVCFARDEPWLCSDRSNQFPE